MASKKCLNCVWCKDHIDFIYCPLPFCAKTFNANAYIDSLNNLDRQAIIDDKETEE